MGRYRKKPVTIEAEQYNGMDPLSWADRGEPFFTTVEDGVGIRLYIKTLEGDHLVSPGDWVITGVKGEKYPCKPDIFEATYEAMDA